MPGRFESSLLGRAGRRGATRPEATIRPMPHITIEAGSGTVATMVPWIVDGALVAPPAPGELSRTAPGVPPSALVTW